MVFSSTVFLFLFLPLTLCIYYNPWLRGRKFRNVFLLLASLLFYAWGEPVFVFLMLISIGIGYAIGCHLHNGRRKWWLVAGVTFHVGLLFVFKYLTFVLGQLGLLVGSLEDFAIALPIGISFFTFQLLSYLFDVYYGKAEAQRSVLNLGLYVALFPQLIAGPIVRYDAIAAEIMGRQENLMDFSEGMMRFIYGLAKKVLIANYMGQLADTIFAMNGSLSVGTAWLGAVAYTLQIYFDFSGYSDMAIGLGRMFGFHFAENFNYPYIAKSATEFWRRWHISLGSWFRDYVYIPLGGNRCSKWRWVLNLFVVWALTGIWHGANYTFLAWGLFYFVLLMVEKFTRLPEKLGVLSHIYAMAAVMIGWVMFRSETFTAGLHYIGVMFGFGSLGLADDYFRLYLGQTYSVLVAGIVFSLPVFPWLKKYGGKLVENAEPVAALGLFVLTLVVAVSSSYNPFIYFNF
ncbi:alginate O-acetyltransferase complex protein AlgI [Selenomonas sp. GACV-9]|uniref:MBOAT family O-acyltransferase n=1 Tax=Selenomonas sp. GACV-9 TaxID=3158782 RepID=UPI0008E4CA25|nr:alginate O-acetyltransferase complex protein AlgI [Selenomonas ruminantium]